jgi:hypothetical protein
MKRIRKIIFAAAVIGNTVYSQDVGINIEEIDAIVIEQNMRTLIADITESGKSKCFQGNCKNGTGSQTLGVGHVYNGDFKAGKFNGPGTLVLANGQVTFSGQWSHGEFRDGLVIFNGDMKRAYVIRRFINGKEFVIQYPSAKFTQIEILKEAKFPE